MLNFGCGPHHADGWINVDVHEGDGVAPDVVVDSADPFAGVDDRSVDRLYMGHVLEHIEWGQVVPLLVDARRILAGELLVVGPDVHRALDEYKTGAISVEEFDDLAEHAERPSPGLAAWTGSAHVWNCHETRIVDALAAAGFDRVRSWPISDRRLDDWPLVSRVAWQCAVSAK